MVLLVAEGAFEVSVEHCLPSRLTSTYFTSSFHNFCVFFWYDRDEEFLKDFFFLCFSLDVKLKS